MDKKNNFCPIQVETIPFRLTIGVIGHSSLEGIDREIFGKTIDKVLADILGKYPKSGFPDVKLCVLSSFVEGADRFIVNRILNNHPDTWLKLILPLTISEYNECEKDLFEELKKKSVSSYSLRKQSLADEYAPNSPPKEAEGLAYQDAGKFIVNHCDILIALWDKQSDSRTAHILDYAVKEQKCSRYMIDPGCLSVFHFFGGNIKNLKKTDLLKEKIEDFNSHIDKSGIFDCKSDIWNIIDEKFTGLLKPDILKKIGLNIPESVQDVIKNRLIPYRVIASLQADHHKKRYQLFGLIILCLAFLAVSSIGFGVIFRDSHSSFFILEFVCLLLIYIIFEVGKKKRTP